MNNNLLRALLWSLCIAFALVGLLWLIWSLGGEQVHSMVNDITMVVFEPALAITILASGNPHYFSGVVWFLSQVLEIFIIVFVVLAAVLFARRQH
jgi:hypothetical protein